MSKPISEHPPEQEQTDIAVMAELFSAIGFEVGDEHSYNLLVEQVETNGERTRANCADGVQHGRCWKLGDGLEVWSILCEQGDNFYYADCRPAFRSRYVRTILTWELVEYDEEGEVIIRGGLRGGTDVVFELQNLTELNDAVFRRLHLHVALAGISYAARVRPISLSRRSTDPPAVHRFELAERVEGFADKACENDYVISGQVLAWRGIRNPVTAADLVWIYVDAADIRLEILANTQALRGELEIGAEITANVWLQGHVLEESDILARYEGVDHEYEQADFWAGLRKGN